MKLRSCLHKAKEKKNNTKSFEFNLFAIWGLNLVDGCWLAELNCEIHLLYHVYVRDQFFLRVKWFKVKLNYGSKKLQLPFGKEKKIGLNLWQKSSLICALVRTKVSPLFCTVDNIIYLCVKKKKKIFSTILVSKVFGYHVVETASTV